MCQEILLSSGLVEEAYQRYGLTANRRGTYLATFRAIAKKYPHYEAGQILADVVGNTRVEEGTWFAAAKNAGLLALTWLVRGHGHEITSADVWAAYASTVEAADQNGTAAETREHIEAIVAGEAPGGFVAQVLGKGLEQ